MLFDNEPGQERTGDEVLATALRRGLGALGDAAMPVPDLGDLASRAPLRPDQRRRRPSLVAGAGILAAAAVVVIAFLVVDPGPSGDGSEIATVPFPAAGWEEIADGPLSARNRATVIWTGREALVVGGDTFVCPGDCDAPDIPLLADGAAYDPATDRWRRIADAPIGFVSAPAAVVGEDIYVSVAGSGRSGGPATLLRYSIADNIWEEIAVPDGFALTSELASMPDALVGYSETTAESESENGEASDWLYNPVTERWSGLADDPLGPSFLRNLVWAGDKLWLFAKSIDDVESGHPPVAEVASYDPGTGVWRQESTSDMLTTGPWLVEGSILVNPSLGCANGGPDEDWGRCVPNGGRYDIATNTWMSLPDEPEAGTTSVVGSGAVGTSGAVFLVPGGHLLDVQSDRWQRLPAIPGDGPRIERQLSSIGTDAFAFGSDDDSIALADGWVWRSGRQPEPGPTPTPVTPTPAPSTTAITTSPTSTSSTTATTTTPTSTPSTTATTTTSTTVPTTADGGPTVPQLSWKQDPIVVNSPVCVPADLPAGLDFTTPIYFRNLGDPADNRLDLITSSAVYTAVDCSWVTALDLEREPGVSDWRCQDYEDGSAVELWDFANGTVIEFPAGGGSAPIENYERPGQLFGLASCDRSDSRNAPPTA